MFAALPRPYCHVGAAEAMFRLSFMRGSLYAAVGLRQGMRFVTRAALHTPLQARLTGHPDETTRRVSSAKLAEIGHTDGRISEREAPNHPRLANAMMFYHNMRGEHDQALIWADRAIASGPLPEEVYRGPLA